MKKDFITKYLFAFVILLSPICAYAIPITITSGETPSASYETLGLNAYEIYNIGLYEPDNEHGWRLNSDGSYSHFRERGTATIYIEDQNGIPAALALGSYEPTDWIITGPGADAIDSILLYGYHHHTITGMNSTATVDERTYEGGGSPYIYLSGAYNWPNGSISEIEGYFGSPITSFVGAYSASSFNIGANTIQVNEPTSLLLFGIGLMGLMSRRKSMC